jgi:hypothetical protein
MLISRVKVHMLEKIGFAIVIVSLVLLLFDRESSREGGGGGSIGLELLLLVANAAGLFYLVMNRSLQRNRLLAHTFSLSLIIAISFSITAIVVEGATLNFNPKKGLFGWLRPEYCF